MKLSNVETVETTYITVKTAYINVETTYITVETAYINGQSCHILSNQFLNFLLGQVTPVRILANYTTLHYITLLAKVTPGQPWERIAIIAIIALISSISRECDESVRPEHSLTDLPLKTGWTGRCNWGNRKFSNITNIKIQCSVSWQKIHCSHKFCKKSDML